MADALASEFFDVSIADGVAALVMNVPQKSNAMSPAFWEDLPRIAAALDADPKVRVVLLSGAGKNFSAGMDLSTFNNLMEMTKMEPGRAAYALRQSVLTYQAALSSLETMRQPVIAAIQGACIGGGIDLITACDIRLGAENAFFSIEEINIGMTADVGTLQRLPKLIPPGVVSELALTGRRFSALEAKDWGLLSAVHSDSDALMAAAQEMARVIASKSPLAVAGTKQSITYARDHTVAAGLEQIASWNGGMLRAEDLMSAMQARMAKKDASFKDIA